ncbi:hypothetical protein [Verrucomicrobium spinosum]|uniref:hypothetical protein n=1 Tax=Verrucomicrobium spinosum TaxID=2736 RepID=UPI000B0F47D9|nr:hypothetical protein [Verrucomicrobium spinosum]
MLVLCALAVLAAGLSTVAAAILVWLINTITNLCFHLTWSSAEASPLGHVWGYWVVAVPVAGA